MLSCSTAYVKMMFRMPAFLGCFVLCSVLALTTASRSAYGAPQSAPVAQSAPAEITAVFETETTGSLTRPISPELFGFNTNNTGGPSWTNEEFVQSVSRLTPGNLRYPGGTIGNFWDWERGWFKMGVKLPIGSSVEKIGTLNRLEEFKKAIDATGAEPIYMLNCLNMDLPNQLAMLHHARELGMPVRYVELGNEFYLEPKEFSMYREKYPTAADYGKAMIPWIKAIKSEFPGVQVAVLGHTGGKQADRWNRSLLSGITEADAVALHIYGKTGFELKGLEFPGDTPEEKMLIEWKAFTAPGGFKKFFSGAFRSGVVLQAAMKHYPASWKFWITEYNTGDNYGRAISSTWAQGLYVATQTALYMQEPRTTLLQIHQITGSVSFAAVHITDHQFSERPEEIGNPATVQWSPTAVGLIFQMITRTAKGMTTARKIEFPNNPQFTADNPSLLGWVFEDGKGARSAFIISLAAEPLTVDVSALGLKGLQGQMLSGSPTTLVAAGSDSLQTVAFEAGDKLFLETYSMTAMGKD